MTPAPARHNALVALLVAVSLAFAWILWPFFAAVFWAAVLALMFTPAYRRLVRLTRGRHTAAAAITLLLCVVAAILPMVLIAAAMVQEAAQLYEDLQSRRIDLAAFAQHVFAALPEWATQWLRSIGLGDLAALQQRAAALAGQASRLIAGQVLNIGMNTFDFLVGAGVMLYLLFFFLRDGGAISARINAAIPLSRENTTQLMTKFAAVIRATVKGNVVVAAVQGALGGAALWALGIETALLGGALMALFSLLPAVGAALVWGPIAAWLLFTGAVWKGVTLIVFGVLVIGLVDNILRPVLVGKDTQMPDYLVLVSTVGGLATMGVVGFVVGPVIAALFIAAWDLYTIQRPPSSD